MNDHNISQAPQALFVPSDFLLEYTAGNDDTKDTLCDILQPYVFQARRGPVVTVPITPAQAQQVLSEMQHLWDFQALTMQELRMVAAVINVL